MNKVQAKQKQSLQEEAVCCKCGMGQRQRMRSAELGALGGGGGQEERRREGERKQACQLTMRQGLAI